jgi:outer membrane lipoprotein SlyB
MSSDKGDEIMKAFAGFVAIAITVAVSSAAAHAHERITDAALGGLTGAVVFGPVGLVAGGIIGYTAGPRIACRLGVERCYRRAHYKH